MFHKRSEFFALSYFNTKSQLMQWENLLV